MNFTKSINLALSDRGIKALNGSGDDGLLDRIFAPTIPMHGRMIHTKAGSGQFVEEAQAYDVHGRFQRSIDRNELNRTLLDKLETMPNVTLHFQQKLTGADFQRKKAWFEDLRTVKAETSYSRAMRAHEQEVSFDLMIGADGAYSAVRFHMMKFATVNYTQEYIDCLWCEFRMQSHPSARYPQGYRISPNHLHIWPAGSSMFIALPSPGGTFVCTLFGPVALFSQLKKACAGNDNDAFIAVFDEMFPGVTQHIPAHELVTQFKQNPHLPLINIKCTPHHFSSSAVIVGDSANAMVPFYGQGMNAGLESVRVLFDIIDRSKLARSRLQAGFSQHDNQEFDWTDPEQRLAAALQEYTTVRTPDTYAIADLALGNYAEMRSGVVNRGYKARKWIEETLDKWIPQLGWKTQYARVSFGHDRYSEVIEKSKRQGRLLNAVFDMVSLGAVGGIAFCVWRYTRFGRT